MKVRAVTKLPGAPPKKAPDVPEGLGMGGVLRHDEGDVRQSRVIRRAHTAGFTLGEISELLALHRIEDCAKVRQPPD